jgi:N-ethylmaleimide reductase
MQAIEKSVEADARAIAMVKLLRESYGGTLMLPGVFYQSTARRMSRKREADLIAFRRQVLANPDLPERSRAEAPKTAVDQSRR